MKFKNKIFFVIIGGGLLLSLNFVFAANSGNSMGFVFSENTGWIRFDGSESSIDYGITIPEENGYLSGYAWGENTGWIKLSGTCQTTGACPGGENTYGVYKSANLLSGYAWGEKVGWIKFAADDSDYSNDSASNYGVYTVNDNIFAGYAWGEDIGWIKFSGFFKGKVKIDARNKVTNGGFDDISSWDNSQLDHVNISGGTVNWDGLNSNGQGVSQGDILTPGRTYRISWDLVSLNSGWIKPYVGIYPSENFTMVGQRHSTVIIPTVSRLYMMGGSSTEGSVDNVEVADVTNAMTTGSLQKGLILDMPLASPYTEAGDAIYTSDFTVGVDSWNSLRTTADNTDGILSVDNVLRVYASVDDNNHYVYNSGTILDITKKYNLSFDYYIPSANTNVDGFNIRNGIGGNYASSFPSQSITGSWQSISGTLAISPLASGNVQFQLTKAGDQTYIGAGVITDDLVYFKNIVFRELDATTKDKTPQGNDGTVSGANLEYDGLVCIATSGGTPDDAIVYINQDKAYGIWEWDFNKGTDAGYTEIYFINDIAGSPNDGYRFMIYSGEQLYLSRKDDGITTNLFTTVASYIAINTDYRIKITRSLAGIFTMYIKGGSFGWDDWTTVAVNLYSNPATDNTHTTSSYFLADLGNGDTISNLKIDGKPISLNRATVSSGSYTTTAPSYDFDGVDDYIDLGMSNPSDLTGDITISTWINPESAGLGGVGRIIDNQKLYLWLQNDNILRMRSDGSTIIQSGAVISNNNWHHILITRPSAGTNSNIYINGVLSGTANQDSGTPIPGTTTTYIGNRYAGSTAFDGQISGMKIYSRVLTTDEIDSLYNREKRGY